MIDFNKPFGSIVGHYEVHPTAAYSQDGHFYDVAGNQLDADAPVLQNPKIDEAPAELPPVTEAPAELPPAADLPPITPPPAKTGGKAKK